MEEVYDFGGVEIKEGTGNKYLDPGVHIVKFSGIKAEKRGANNTPFMDIEVTDEAGATATHSYCLKTAAGPSGISAFSITKEAIVRMIMAVYGLDPDSAGERIGKPKSLDALVQQLSSLLIGKPVAILLGGKHILNSDPSKGTWVKAQFASYTFVVAVKDKDMLRFSDKLITGEKIAAAGQGAPAEASKAKADW